MSEREPDFRDLVGDDLAPGEAARLERVHRLLVQAGPPADLPPELAELPEQGGARIVGLPRRRAAATLVLAAALAAAAFGGGYLVGHRDSGFEKFGAPIAMRGEGARLASIQLGKADSSGNWPLVLRVRGLPELPEGGYYELYLTRGDKLGPSCGTFRVHEGVTEVTMNAPYTLRRWDGWVVVAHAPGKHESEPLLTT